MYAIAHKPRSRTEIGDKARTFRPTAGKGSPTSGWGELQRSPMFRGLFGGSQHTHSSTTRFAPQFINKRIRKIPELARRLHKEAGHFIRGRQNTHVNKEVDERQKQEMRDLLMDYLESCPNAMDTLDGIAGFWLTRQRVRTRIPVLLTLLEEMVAEGVLESVASGDQKRYRLKGIGTR